MGYVAYIQENKIQEIHDDPDANGVPINQRFTPQYLESCVDISDVSPLPEFNWSAYQVNGEWVFAPYVAPPLTPEQILANQSEKLAYLKRIAELQKTALTARIGVLNEAIDYEIATPEEVAELPLRVAQRKEWGLYAIYLGRVTSQEGWPPDVDWPVQPIAGMDLTTSSVVTQGS